MTSNAIAVCSAVLWLSCAATDVGQVTSTATEGLSLADMSRAIESQQLFMSADTPFDLLGAWTTGDDRNDPTEGRGKKNNPMKTAMMMGGVSAASMLMMKALAAVKLFIVHAFFATKLGLVIGAYLLASKLMEMKQPPAKKVKWVSAPPHFDEHPPQIPEMQSHYPDAVQSSYEPQQAPQQHQQQQSEQYGPPPQQQQQQQQYMSYGDFGGGGGVAGGDMQAHYSHISPVTYRPAISRNQSDNTVKSAGRVNK